MTRHSLRHATAVAAIAALALTGLLVTSEPGLGDDRDLLRFTSSDPYLFIVLDTSSSMNLKLGGGNTPLIGDGDNPQSRIYAAKEALYKVFTGVTDINFGFATYNQDSPAAMVKHWLYFARQGAQDILPTWPIDYPNGDTNGLTKRYDSDGDGINDSFTNDTADLGDVFTLGRHFTTDPEANGVNVAGSCASPLPLGALGTTARLKINRFALIGAPGEETSSILWLQSSAGTLYKLTIAYNSSSTIGVGDAYTDTDGDGVIDDTLLLDFTLEQKTASPNCATTATWGPVTLSLVQDSVLNQTVIVDGQPPGGAQVKSPETVPGLWSYSDVLQSASCVDLEDKNVTRGGGWEGNYDSGDYSGIAAIDTDPDLDITDVDKFCFGPPGNQECNEYVKPVQQTSYSTVGLSLGRGRGLDRGDLLPFDWNNDNHDDFMERLAPNRDSEAVARFGVAYHFQDTPNATKRALQKRFSIPPMVATGHSPISRAAGDFRCYYVGDEQKCDIEIYYGDGWKDLACTYDSDWGCRKPYQIVISDGEDTCEGPSPTSDVANLKNKGGVKTWTILVGPTKANGSCTSPLFPMANNGDGQCIVVANRDQLRDEIEAILGEIREEARAFASAAVPTVQAEAQQGIFLSNFTPLNDTAIWDGHLNAFLKPLPLDPDTGQPDTTDPRFLWDSGAVMVDEQYDSADFLGPDASQRRVFYSLGDSAPGKWGLPSTNDADTDGFRLLEAPADATAAVSLDLMDAFGVADLTSVEETIDAVLTLKTETRDDTGELIDYLLGDIFHSDPVVIQQPNNVTYLRLDLEADADADTNCEASGAHTAADGDGDSGYRCFNERQQFRRHVIGVGSNDGMFHFFNAAQFRVVGVDLDDPPDGVADTFEKRFDTGTGHEIFAYMPRLTMPTVREIYVDNPTVHQFSVDGSAAAADVFIDPLDDGGTWPDPDERAWHTLLMSGLREGGTGYFALNVTMPDTLEVDTDIDQIKPIEGADYVPSCLPDGAWTSTQEDDCGLVPYGAPLWQFVDEVDDSVITGAAALTPPSGTLLDEDGNGVGDLGDTWSRPTIGRIRVCDTSIGSDCAVHVNDDPTGSVIDKYVAIFGGGMDTHAKLSIPADVQGDWLYMVDVETGKVLYKRRFLNPYDATESGGPAAAEPAAVDTDQDGYIDRIYIGTLGGFLYRVDLVSFDSMGNLLDFPTVVDVPVEFEDGTVSTASRIDPTAWVPKAIFDANLTEDTTDADGDGVPDNPGVFVQPVDPRPIYFQPTVLSARGFGGIAIAFGTGDREDLWAPYFDEARFFVFIDDSEEVDSDADLTNDTPFSEENFTAVDPDGLVTADNLLQQGTPGTNGWYMRLNVNERVIAQAFSLVGITFFPTYLPDVGVTDADGNPIPESECGDEKASDLEGRQCSKTGVSRIFLVDATNGNPLLLDAAGAAARYRTVSQFVTEPFSEFGQTRNQDDDDDDDTPTADDLTAAEEAVMELLKKLFPESCRFTNARIDIKTVASDTSLERIASIPICLLSTNWKEF